MYSVVKIYNELPLVIRGLDLACFKSELRQMSTNRTHNLYVTNQ